MMSSGPTGPGLLVSVRSAAEALAALDGGADLIDVKEPSRGPLGAADQHVVGEVVQAVRGRVPVSVALGEWADYVAGEVLPGVTYVKWGLSRLVECDAESARHLRHAEIGRAVPVLVAYADSERAESPAPETLARSACDLRFPAFLIDTAVKDGSTLVDWISPTSLARIRSRLADFGVRVALAGSLDETCIRTLLPLAPDWFAVRGAACIGGRGGTVSAERVRQLRTVISAG